MDDPPETGVSWRAFGPEAFADAGREGKPVLLSISTPWCRPCREMDREVYADPEIAALIESSFVPVRADGDRRPRVRDRYTMGGFPSTVFLTSEGEVLTGGTLFEPGTFRDVVERVEELWDRKGAGAGRVPRSLRSAPPAATVTPEVLEEIESLLAGRVREEFDPEHGGWGTEAKFPLPGTVTFALKRAPECATRTLDPVRGHLLDTADGGFFRYAGARDWSDPHREKLLDANAALLGAFADAYLHTGDEAYRETASGLVDFLTGTLRTGDGFAGAQTPAEEAYYRLDPSERADEAGPGIDETVLADRNGLAIASLLRYSAYTDDEQARGYAVRALERLDAELIEDGVVRRYADPDAPTGLLLDQARVCRALTTAAGIVDPAHVDTAASVADRTIESLRTDGGFRDGPPEGAGLLDRPLYSIDASAELANALVDLYVLTGAERYWEAARDAVAAFAGARERFGVEVAQYATAAARLSGVLRIDVATEPGTDLHRAALRVADHEKVVRLGGDTPDGTARAVHGDVKSEPASAPAELGAGVRDVLEATADREAPTEW
jgi:uncharacterized protein YyaL (SSP411 family)